tara:strand:+ start:444 stop:632 length:189 start_codon:yes stop_codon:yes gene_type:complete
MKKGWIQIDFTLVFQILNMLLFIALVYALIRYLVKSANEQKASIEKLEIIEAKVRALSEKEK